VGLKDTRAARDAARSLLAKGIDPAQQKRRTALAMLTPNRRAAALRDMPPSTARITRYSHRASLEEIAENGYNLNIPRYVDTFEPEDEIDVAAVQKDILRIEAELAEVRAKMAGYLKELGVDA
jgi:type I restriction-modification system DNA methylase subunit